MPSATASTGELIATALSVDRDRPRDCAAPRSEKRHRGLDHPGAEQSEQAENLAVPHGEVEIVDQLAASRIEDGEPRASRATAPGMRVPGWLCGATTVVPII